MTTGAGERLFVAIPLPAAERARLAAWQEVLPDCRQVAPETMHVTLAFLGELDAEVRAAVVRAFAGIAAPAFDLALSGIGLFGERRPHVVHAGLVESPALRALRAEVVAAVSEVGIAPPAGSYTPHVTLARPNRRHDRAAFEPALAALAQAAGPPFRVSAFHLYRSHLRPEGARYESLARFPLA